MTESNELRLFALYAPPRLVFSGSSMMDCSAARRILLRNLSRGSIDERINRRSGQVAKWEPFKASINKAMRRNWVNQLRKRGLAYLGQ
jgi:hypothetical protein